MCYYESKARKGTNETHTKIPASSKSNYEVNLRSYYIPVYNVYYNEI